jgi:hypothetical protein
MDQAGTINIKDYCKPVLCMTLPSLSSRFAVALVKVLHLIDGVKVYVQYDVLHEPRERLLTSCVIQYNKLQLELPGLLGL